MMVKIYLVDGTFELFRAYYSSPKKNVGGREVGASIGFARNIANLILYEKATHIAIAFDHVIESFRNDLYDGYKTGEGLEEEIKSQFPIVEQISSLMGIVTWPMIDFEADDALATACRMYKDFAPILICSPDKDLCQCVDEGVHLFDRIRSKIINTAGVKEKFGIKPQSIPDYLALIGDTADGIPGIPRWGAKSAASILEAFESIENIPLDVDLWPKIRGKKTLLENFIEFQDELKLYKKLATLRTDVPLQEDFKDLKWCSFSEDLEAFSTDVLGNGETYKKLGNHLKAKRSG